MMLTPFDIQPRPANPAPDALPDWGGEYDRLNRYKTDTAERVSRIVGWVGIVVATGALVWMLGRTVGAF